MEQNSKLKIIQGDSFSVNVYLENVMSGLIESVYFTCASLKICKKLEFDIDKYILKLTPEETQTLPKFIGDYDLTVKFKDGNVITAAYRSLIEVLPKTNELLCNKI